MDAMANDCAICTEKIAPGRTVCCAKCSGTSCRDCFQQYLMNSTMTPSCMHCRVPVSDDFVLDNTSLTWRTKAYKVYRENLLFEIERARMPESQPYAAAYAQASRALLVSKAEIERLKGLVQRTNDVKQAIALQQRLHSVLRHVTMGHGRSHWQGGPADVSNILAAAALGSVELDTAIRVFYQPMALGGAGGGAAPVAPMGAVVRAFVMACPGAECRGFLAPDYSCGLCSAVTCESCHEIKEDDHVCNADVVANVKALKKEARPCPTCATQISKIDGCDQMWCTQCKTTFSWRTGLKEEGHTHNPHYYEYMRAHGGMPRAPGDGGCMVMPNANHIAALFSAGERLASTALTGGWGMWHWNQRNPGKTRTWNNVPPIQPPVESGDPMAPLPDRVHYLIALMEQHQKIGHNRRGRAQLADNHDLRVRFMAQDQDERTVKIQLQRRDKAYRKEVAKHQIYDMVHTAGGDVFNALLRSGGGIGACHDTYTQINQLFIYANGCLERLEKAYTCVTDKYSLKPYIWRLHY